MTVVFLNISDIFLNTLDLVENMMFIVLDWIRLSKPLTAVWDLAVQTVGIAAMQFLQATL